MRRRDVLLGSAALFSAATTPARSADLMRGLWRDGAGRFGVGAFPEFGEGLFAFDYAGLRMGSLRPAAAAVWEMSGALDDSAPAVETIRLDGPALRVGDRRLSPEPIARRGLTVRSGAITLSAEIAVLEGVRPRGAVLMIYGSGPAPKEAFDPWALWFLGEGFTVIAYDKRGCGRSGGDWRLTSLEDLAADAGAVLAAARRQGLAGPVFAWGASQAGWIEPQLGAAGVVDGVIMHAGSVTTPAEQVLAQVQYELKAYGFDQAEIDRAKAYYALDLDVSRGRRPWAEIDAAYKAATSAKVEWLLEPPPAATDPQRTMIRLMADFEPSPYWRASKVPTLALYGGKDWIVPAEANLSRLQAMVAGRAELETRLIPNANHLMFVADTGTRDEYPRRSRLAPEYFEAMRDWLSRRN